MFPESLTFPFSLLVLCIQTTMAGEYGSFYFTGPGVMYSTAWGSYCYNYGGYIPTCGWRMTLSSSRPLTSMTDYASSVVMVDDYTFDIIHQVSNLDLTHRQDFCESITIQGDFQDREPNIAVSFSCVCNDTTSGVCVDVPYITVPIAEPANTTLPATTPTTRSVHTVPTTVTTPPTETTATMPSWTTVTDASNIRLRKVKDKCYDGSDQEASVSANDIESCGAICMDTTECVGVNFRTGTSLCSIVLKIVEQGSSDLIYINGCEFWEVLGKS